MLSGRLLSDLPNPHLPQESGAQASLFPALITELKAYLGPSDAICLVLWIPGLDETPTSARMAAITPPELCLLRLILRSPHPRAHSNYHPRLPKHDRKPSIQTPSPYRVGEKK